MSLAALLVTAECLCFLGAGFTVDTDARIRATVAAGETVVAALQAYRQEHAGLPARIEDLVPRYLQFIPQPVYGAKTWDFTSAVDSTTADQPLGIELPMVSQPAGVPRRSYSLSVRVGGVGNSAAFRRPMAVGGFRICPTAGDGRRRRDACYPVRKGLKPAVPWPHRLNGP
jgi:hypothetical protein